MSRERYWGLYDVGQRQWLDVDHEWKAKPVKPRMRHDTIYEAMSFLENGNYPRCIVPRPFYVVRKPKSVSPALEKVLEAARRIAQWSPHPPGGIKAAIEEYDGKEYMYESLA